MSPAFRRPDPADTRDVREVLRSEGIDLDEGGKADSSRHISREELAALIDSPEDEVLGGDPALDAAVPA